MLTSKVLQRTHTHMHTCTHTRMWAENHSGSAVSLSNQKSPPGTNWNVIRTISTCPNVSNSCYCTEVTVVCHQSAKTTETPSHTHTHTTCVSGCRCVWQGNTCNGWRAVKSHIYAVEKEVLAPFLSHTHTRWTSLFLKQSQTYTICVSVVFQAAGHSSWVWLAWSANRP